MAGLTACGDKVEVQGVTTPQQSNVVRSVTVTPSSATLNQGDKITLAASVNADAGVTDRTVTWRSANTAIASVDQNGVVTAGTTAGTTTISALAKADTTVRGAAVITVNAAPTTGGGAPATVTIASVNQTVCVVGGGCNSVPANLGNVTGQIDVTLNVDPGAQRLVGVDLVLNCTGNGNSGQDTVVASQTLASANVVDAEAASAPVTLSFNTATFNSSTGAVAFRNGACTIKARARTNSAPGGAITTVTSTAQNITLNNNDVVLGTMASTKSAINPTTGLLWNGGDVTISATPVMFSGRVPAALTITFECRTVTTATGTGTRSATFVDANDFPAPLTSQAAPVPGGGCVAGATPPTGTATPAANDIDNITDPAATPVFALVDAAGQPFVTNGCGVTALCTSASYLANPAAPVAITAIRLDTQKPFSGTFALSGNADQGIGAQPWLGTSFRFAADSAAGFRGPDAAAGAQTRNLDNRSAQATTAGVDAVTYQFQTATSATGTFSNVAATNPTQALGETNTSTSLVLRLIATDALGNADTAYRDQSEFVASTAAATAAASRFGVDLTAPAITLGNQIADKSIAITNISGNPFLFTETDNLSGNGLTYVAQVRNYNSNSTAVDLLLSGIEGTISTNACGTSGLAAQAGATAAGACISPAMAVDRTQANGTDPCVIGRFNAASTAAGANALPVFDRSGAQIGFCTPVVYTPGSGGTAVPWNAGGVSGYYTTTIIASDIAGNRAQVIAPTTIYEETAAPVTANIDLPGSITGNSTASFPASITESGSNNAGDITASFATLEYTAAPNAGTANAGGGTNVYLRYPNISGPGVAFDNTLTRTATATPTIPNFAKSLTISLGLGNAVTAAANNVDSVKVQAQDPAIVVATGAPNAGAGLTAKLAPSVQLVSGATSSFSGNFNSGFRDSVSTATVSACVSACAAANPTSVTIFGIAQGLTGVFNNPFAGGSVSFWYRPNAGGAATQTSPWFFITSVTSGVTTDTGTGNGRSWIFSTTWTPPVTAPDGTKLQQVGGGSLPVQIRVIGVNTNGDAVGTLGTTTVTLTNP